MQIILPNIMGLISPHDLFKLDGAKCYFGEADKDPRMYPIDTFLDAEMMIIAPHFLWIKQGLFWHNGNIVNIYTKSHEVSVFITDVYGRQLLYIPRIDINHCPKIHDNPDKNDDKEKENQKNWVKYASEIYPFYTDDNMILSFSLLGKGIIKDAIYAHQNEMSIQAKLQEHGILRTILSDYDLGHVNMYLKTYMSGIGLLKSILAYYDLGHEQINMNANMMGIGVLRSILLNNDAGYEPVKMSYMMNGQGVLQ